MDLVDVLRACVRRWYVFIPLALLAVGLSNMAYGSARGEYYSSAVIGFASPSNQINYAGPGAPLSRNGLLDVVGSTGFASMIAVALEEPAVAERVLAAGDVYAYDARLYPARERTQAPPQVLIEASGPDREGVLTTLRRVIGESPRALQNLQIDAQVPADRMVTMLVVAEPSVPTYGAPPRIRLFLAILTGGILLTILSTVISDFAIAGASARRVASKVAYTSGLKPHHDENRLRDYVRYRKADQRDEDGRSAIRDHSIGVPVEGPNHKAETVAAPLIGRASLTNADPKVPWLLGILCLLIPILPQNSVLPGPLKGNGSPPRLLALVLLGLVVLGFATYRRTRRAETINPGVVIVVAFFGLWTCLYGAGLLDADRSPGWTLVQASRTRWLLTFAAYLGVALYAILSVHCARQRHFVLACLTVGLTLNNMIGLAQAVLDTDLRTFFVPPGFVTSVDDVSNVQRLGLSRVMGTAQHPIEFSVLAAVSIPLCIYFARFASRRDFRTLSWLGCGIGVLAMPAAVSRSGLVSLAVALLVYMLAFSLRAIFSALLISISAVGVYIAIFPNVASALWLTIAGSADDDSIRGRTVDYAVVGDIFRAHPILGLGLGGQPTFFDNQWLQAIVQGGSIGVIAMLILSVGLVFGITASLRQSGSVNEREQSYLVGSVGAGIIASTLTFDAFFYQQITFVLFVSFGLLWATYRVERPGHSTNGSSDKSRAFAIHRANQSRRFGK